MNNLIATERQELEELREYVKEINKWVDIGEKLFLSPPVMFSLGAWWADRPWRTK